MIKSEFEEKSAKDAKDNRDGAAACPATFWTMHHHAGLLLRDCLKE